MVAVGVVQAGNDFEQLESGIERVEKNLGKTPDQVVTDGGFVSRGNIVAMKGREIEFIAPCVDEAGKGESSYEGRGVSPEYHSTAFVYDAQTDSYRCPQGKILRYEGKKNLKRFKHTTDRPTLIIVDSHIAYGAPNKQDTSAAHGEPLGKEEIKLAKHNYGWPEDAEFFIPRGVRVRFQSGDPAPAARHCTRHGGEFEAYPREYPEFADHGYGMLRRELPEGWDKGLPAFSADDKGLATRDASGVALNAIAPNVPWLLGGSAIVGPSCKTHLTFTGAGDFNAENPAGRKSPLGIREHAMGAVLNGLSLSKLRPFGCGFLIFSQPATRRSA